MKVFGAPEDRPVEVDFSCRVYTERKNDAGEIESIDESTAEFRRRRSVSARAMENMRDALRELKAEANAADVGLAEALMVQYGVLLEPASAGRMKGLLESEDEYVDVGDATRALEWCLSEMGGGLPSTRRPASSAS